MAKVTLALVAIVVLRVRWRVDTGGARSLGVVHSVWVR